MSCVATIKIFNVLYFAQRFYVSYILIFIIALRYVGFIDWNKNNCRNWLINPFTHSIFIFSIIVYNWHWQIIHCELSIIYMRGTCWEYTDLKNIPPAIKRALLTLHTWGIQLIVNPLLWGKPSVQPSVHLLNTGNWFWTLVACPFSTPRGCANWHL